MECESLNLTLPTGPYMHAENGRALSVLDALVALPADVDKGELAHAVMQYCRGGQPNGISARQTHMQSDFWITCCAHALRIPINQ